MLTIVDLVDYSMVKLNILVVILFHDHAVVVDGAKIILLPTIESKNLVAIMIVSNSVLNIVFKEIIHVCLWNNFYFCMSFVNCIVISLKNVFKVIIISLQTGETKLPV